MNKKNENAVLTLSKLAIGQEAVITKVGGEGVLRLRLLDMGLIPKTKIKIIKMAPMGDPIEITVRGYELTLRKDDAANIEVSLAEGEQSIAGEQPNEKETTADGGADK